MKRHNKILLFLFIFIYTLPAYSNVFIDEWTKENGLLPYPGYLLIDNQKRIWANKYHSDTAYYYDPITLKKTYVPGLEMPQILDPYNNIIFLSSTNGIYDSYKLYTKDGEIKHFANDVESIMGPNFFGFTNNNFAFIDNYAYFGMNLKGFPIVYYMKYDSLNNIWYFDKNDNRIFYPYQNTNDTIMLYNSTGFVKRGREIIIPTLNKGIFALNHDTKKYRFIKNPILEILSENKTKVSKPYID